MDDTQWLADLRPGDKLIRVWRGSCQVVTVDRLTRTQVVVHRGMYWTERYHRIGARIAQKVGDDESTVRLPVGNEVEFIDLSNDLARQLGLIGIVALRVKNGQGVSIEHLSLDDLRQAVAHAQGLLDKVGRP